MKRIISILMTLTIVLSLGIATPKNVNASGIIEFEFKNEVEQISITWKKYNNASYYDILKRDLTDYAKNTKIDPDDIKFQTFKTKLAETNIIDNDVVFGHVYEYVINAYDSKGNKIASTRADDDTSLNTVNAGVSVPYIDFSPKSRNKKLYITIYTGNDGDIKNCSTEIWRKESNEKDYKLIDTVNNVQSGVGYRDKNVKAGCVYSYIVKSYIEKDGKKIYGVTSNAEKIIAGNTNGSYKVKCYTKSKTTNKNKFTVKFRMKNKNNNNGRTILVNKQKTYIYQKSKKSKEYRYKFKLTKYSLDNKNWKKIPKKGIEMPRKGIYLKGVITAKKKIRFATKNVRKSQIGDIIKYDGNTGDADYSYIDLVKKKGKAVSEYLDEF